jgi:hypothetical protein
MFVRLNSFNSMFLQLCTIPSVHRIAIDTVGSQDDVLVKSCLDNSNLTYGVSEMLCSAGLIMVDEDNLGHLDTAEFQKLFSML